MTKIRSVLKWSATAILVGLVLVTFLLIAGLVAAVVTPVTTIGTIAFAVFIVGYLAVVNAHEAFSSLRKLPGRTLFVLTYLRRRPRRTLCFVTRSALSRRTRNSAAKGTKSILLLPLIIFGAIALLISGWIGLTVSAIFFLTAAVIGYFIHEISFVAVAAAFIASPLWYFRKSLRRRPRLTLKALASHRLWREIRRALRLESKEAEKRYTDFLLAADAAIGNRGGC